MPDTVPRPTTPNDAPKPSDVPAKLTREEKLARRAERQEARALERRAEKILENWSEVNRGGAPLSTEFIMAALQQGLTPQQIRTIARSQALGGPQTSGHGSYSSPELLDYFTANPGEIPALLAAVRSTRDVPRTYADYLAQGGVEGGYRAYNQVLQESVLGIGSARDAYLSGAGRTGVGLVEVPGFGLYDPASPTYQSLAAQGLAEPYEVDAEDAADYQDYLARRRGEPESETYRAPFSAPPPQGLQAGSAAANMLQTRQNTQAAQSNYFQANELYDEEV